MGSLWWDPRGRVWTLVLVGPRVLGDTSTDPSRFPESQFGISGTRSRTEGPTVDPQDPGLDLRPVLDRPGSGRDSRIPYSTPPQSPKHGLDSPGLGSGLPGPTLVSWDGS